MSETVGTLLAKLLNLLRIKIQVIPCTEYDISASLPLFKLSRRVLATSMLNS